MSYENPFKRVASRLQDFVDEHYVTSIYLGSIVAATAAISSLWVMSNAIQPPEWKDAVRGAAQNDAFSSADFAIRPDITNPNIAIATITYEDCVIEGVSLALEEDKNTINILTYDFSNSGLAISRGVLPENVSGITKASELVGKISLEICRATA